MASGTSAAPFVETFNFTWTAPSTPTVVTFNYIGNAVNGNNSDDCDNQSMTGVISTTAASNNVVSNLHLKAMDVFPNPAEEYFMIKNFTENINALKAFLCWDNCIRFLLYKVVLIIKLHCKISQAAYISFSKRKRKYVCCYFNKK